MVNRIPGAIVMTLSLAVWNFRIAGAGVACSEVAHGSVENSGFPNFMEVA